MAPAFLEAGVTTEGIGLLGVGILTTSLCIVGAYLWWWLRESDVDWNEQIGMSYLWLARRPEEVKNFLKRNFTEVVAADLKEAPRRANINAVVTELVVAAKLKFGNLTPKPENGFIIRDFMNSTIVEWRKRAIKERERDRAWQTQEANKHDLTLNPLTQSDVVPSAEESDDDEIAPRTPEEQDEYDQMHSAWNILVNCRLKDLVGQAGKATALYFILEEDEEHVVHVLSSKVVKKQYGTTA